MLDFVNFGIVEEYNGGKATTWREKRSSIGEGE